jgi:TP901 family phage tail tape measure protein
MADVNANIGVNIDTSLALAQLKSLQRQISQFHTSIARSSETAALAQKSLQKNFLNSVNAIGSFSAELRTVKTTTESFTSSLEGNKFSMREYFRYAGGATKTFGKLFKSEFDTIGKVAEERVKRLQTQYIKMGRDASGAMQAISITPTSLDMQNYGTKTAIAAQKQALFNQLMKQGSTNLLNFGKNTQWAGRQLMVGFTIPLAMVGSAATKTFMDMEAQALKFRKVYGDLFTPKEETQAALDNIMELGKQFTKYGVAVSATVGLAAEAAAAGFSGLDLQRQTTEATRLSVLGQIDNQKALETTISLQNAFGMSSDKLADSINFLNAVENQTVVSLDDITTAIPKVAPVIQQLGGDVKDLTFFIAAMKEGGINASEGANALKSGLAALINPTGRASEMLKSFGINAKEIVTSNKGDLKATVIEFATALNQLDPLNRAQAIEQMFGKFQFARLSTLFANVAKDGNQAARVLNLANSSVEELSALSEQELGMTADSAMNKFKKTVEDLKAALIPVGQAFLEAVTPIVEFVGNILEKFADLSAGTKKAITLMVTIVGGLGPILLMTFGLLANGVANIIKLFLTLRNGYLRLTGQSQILGEQTQYLTMEQIDAAAASHSLNQAHANLTQQFTAESAAVNQLITAYQGATRAGAAFAAANPGSMLPRGRGYTNGVVSVPGSGNKDTVPAMLTPGEAVIPAAMAKKYAPLINGMIAGNIPGYRRGLTPGDSEFSQSIAGAAPQRSQAGVQAFLEKELKAVPETLVEEFKSLVRTVSEEVNLSEKALKERLKSFRAQYNANIGQQEELQFAHLDTGRRVKAGELQASGAVVDPRTQSRLREFVDAAGADALVDLKTGFGVELTGFLNNAMQGAGASLEDAIADFNIGGVDKFRKSVEIGGGNMEDLGPELQAFDARFQQNLEEAYSQGARIIVDSQAQIEQMRQEALAKGEAFDDTIYVAMDTVAEQTRQNVLELGSGLDTVFQEAMNTITEIRFQGLTPEQQAGLPAGYGRGSKGGRVTPGGTATFRKRGGVGSFTNAPLAQESVAINKANLARPFANSAQFQSRVDLSGPSASNLNTNPAQVNRLVSGQPGVPQLNEQQIQERNKRALARIKRNSEAMAKQAVQSTAIAAGTQSPSKKTIPIGEDIARGLEVGMANRKDEVAAAGTSLGKNATQSISRGAKTSGPITTGQPFNIQKTQGGVTVGQVAAGAPVSPDITAKAVEQARVMQTATDRIRGLDRNIMGASFAISSLSGIASMSGGALGNMAGTISKVTGAMFALQAITGLLTQTNAVALVQKRLEIAKSVGANAMAAGPMFGGLSKAISGRAGLTGIIARLGLRLVAFLGPIGMAIAAVGTVYGAFKFFKNRSDQAAFAAEGLAKAMTLSKDKINILAELLGQTPTPRAGSGARVSANQLDAKGQAAVDELRSSKEFLDKYKNEIRAIKEATVGEATIAFNAIALDLSGQGFTKDAIKTYIDALGEEANKTDVALKFKQIDLSKTAGQAAAVKLAKDVTTGLNKAFKGKIIPLPIADNLSAGATATSKIELTKKEQKELNISSAALANTFAGLTSAFGNQTIKADEYNKTMAQIATTIPQGTVGMMLMDKILTNVSPTIAKASAGIKDYDTKMLLLRASLVNASVAETIFQDLMSKSPAKVASAKAELEKYRIATDALAKNVVVTDPFKQTDTSTAKEKSPFQLAIDQLKQQIKELSNTVKAYSTLRNAGVAAGKAFAIAKDPILAAAVATTKVGTDKWKQLIKLIKETDAALVKSKLTELRADRDYTRQFTAIVPVLQELGLNSEEIQNIFADPSFAQQFIKNVKNGKIEVKDLEDIIKVTMQDREAKLNLDLSLKNEDEFFDEALNKANEMFDKVQAGIEASYRGQIKSGEDAVEKTQKNVQDIQDEIDGIQTTINKKQRDIEINITREIEKYQAQIDVLQNTIKEKFDAPLAKLSDEGDILSNNLSLIDRQTSKINEKYDAQAAALTKVSEINSEIANQQKQQIGLADALSRGDIAAAAAAAQEMRATASAGAQGRQSGVLDAARAAELSSVTSGGMTRVQIEERQFQISQQSFALQQQRKVLEQSIADIEAKQIAPLNLARLAAETAIRVEEDKIYNIQVGRLANAQTALTKAEGELKITQEKLKADLAIIEQNKQALNDEKIARDLAFIQQEKGANAYKELLTQTDGVAKGIVDKIKSLATTVTTIHNIHTVYTSSGSTGSSGTTKKMYGGKIMPMSYGGMVPKYMAVGGKVGSDTVPAMLTPGEFVMNKSATKRFGPMLESMNNSKYPSMIKDLTPTTYTNVNSSMVTPIVNNMSTTVSDNSSTMYNYSVGINVNESNASSNDIARAVIGQIKYIDSQRIRGQR